MLAGLHCRKIGRSTPFDEEVVPFEQDNLLLLRHMIAEMAPEYVIAPQIVEDLILDGRRRPVTRQRHYSPTGAAAEESRA
ncbi:MAG: hypothetical protein WA414_08670 [Acidobacteriaceae bacterium]